ncbi:hypothetical protein Gorai_005720 [Gossypium raimondii]|uniref:DUF4283 domain-containing protein n=1 Tax=Gossypium raimondii TaxID=29730 RepID=A0A7J8QDY8_GOSRA|nr:hypothetical protein [Gossypium raimondii]
MSWFFNNHLLLLQKLEIGEDSLQLSLHHVLFWVQIHDLPPGIMSETMTRRFKAFLGEFLDYDTRVPSIGIQRFIRVRVHIDVWLPFKQKKKGIDVGADGYKDDLSLGWRQYTVVTLRSYSQHHIYVVIQDNDDGFPWRFTGNKIVITKRKRVWPLSDQCFLTTSSMIRDLQGVGSLGNEAGLFRPYSREAKPRGCELSLVELFLKFFNCSPESFNL